MKRPVLLLGAGLMLLSAVLKISFPLFLCLSALFFIVTFTFSFFIKQRLHLIIVAFAFLLFSLVGGLADNNLNFARQNADNRGEARVAITDIRKSEYGYVAVGKLENLNGKGIFGTKIRLYLDDSKPVERGDKITVKTDLSLMEDNNHYFSQNVFFQGKRTEILSHKKCADFLQFAMGKLQNGVRKIVGENLSGTVADFVLAVIVGDSSGIDDETYLNMQISGILHMIVVSGTHFTTVLAAIMFFVRRLFPKRKVKGFISLFVILFIMLFCGFSMPVVRSGIAYLILTLGIFLDRDGDSLCALAATLSIILFICPYGFYSVSLLLTISATFGILVLSPIIIDVTKIYRLRQNELLYDFLNVIAVTVSANITTLPILMYVFDSVSMVSLLANLMINYSVSAVLVLALLAVIGAPVVFVSKPLFLISGLLSNYSLWAIDFCANLPFASIKVNGKHFSAVTVMIYATVTVIYFLFFKKRRDSHNSQAPPHKVFYRGNNL